MKTNSQFIRTDRAIINALVALLKHKPFEKITVQDILDETPVSRATFYAHFQDKYEIAEKMIDYFFEMKKSVIESIHPGSTETFNQTMQRAFYDNMDLTKALLKVHTDTANFRQRVAQELEKDYLRTATSPGKDIEARIFAQAYTELHLAFIDTENADFSFDAITNICINVTMRLLGLSDDSEAKEYLYNKIERKGYTQKAARKRARL